MNNPELKFAPGDTVKVFTRDPTASKVHATPFEGIVIAISGNKTARTFTVRKISSAQVAIERIFPANSPAIEKIEVVKKGKVRRAKLYYLRHQDAAARSSA